jgi:hypothetical protein
MKYIVIALLAAIIILLIVMVCTHHSYSYIYDQFIKWSINIKNK